MNLGGLVRRTGFTMRFRTTATPKTVLTVEAGHCAMRMTKIAKTVSNVPLN